MDDRLFFAVGDLAVNLATGALVGLICGLLVTPGWHMWLTMLLTMAIGMLLALLLWIPASICFGAMEVMVPMMLSGMFAGMVVGMSAAMFYLPLGVHVLTGAFCALISLNIVWILNQNMRGIATDEYPHQ